MSGRRRTCTCPCTCETDVQPQAVDGSDVDVLDQWELEDDEQAAREFLRSPCDEDDDW